MLKIITADNGWLVEVYDEHDPSQPPQRHVFEYDDGDELEVKAFARLLWSINMLIGPTTSRYSKARIYVEVKPGDKHDDFIEDEP